VKSIKPSKKVVSKQRTLQSVIGYILFVLGLIGFAASMTLSIDKVELIKNPNFSPICNISPLISCGSVMNTSQAEAFGFMNSFLGVAGFAAVATIGVAILAGATFKRWFWLGLQAGTIFGVGFISWLYYQSVFVIGALCPFCMVVWSVMIPIFWYVTLYNFRQKNIMLQGFWLKLSDFAQKHHGDILVAWFAGGIGIILVRFWYYWSTLL
jgi:uncharacterized membrane protein